MPDLTGFEVVTTDEQKIGKVDEASNESGSSWIVVDTGFWIFGKKRMIPAGAIESVNRDERTLRVALSKNEINEAPDYGRRASSRTPIARRWVTITASVEQSRFKATRHAACAIPPKGCSPASTDLST